MGSVGMYQARGVTPHCVRSEFDCRENERKRIHMLREHTVSKRWWCLLARHFISVFTDLSSPDGHDTPFPFCLTPSCLSPDRRWFKPVVLNLSKDKRVLYRGSDKYKVLGLHMQDEI